MRGVGFQSILVFLMLWFGVLTPAASQSLHAIATVDQASSSVHAAEAQTKLVLGLSTPIPFRVFTLNAPDRLVLDFQEVDWRGLNRDAFVKSDVVKDLRFGIFQPGWSRMVLDLAKPMQVKTAQMQTTGAPRLEVVLQETSRAAFDQATGQQDTGLWLRRAPNWGQGAKTSLRIALDPGHGGVDPGAVRAGIMEKDIALQFSLELAEVIENLTDFDVVLTRDADFSVSLGDRVRIARDADADIFLSVHSNTVTRGNASGAAVYTLSDHASDASSAKLAELENRADLAVGLSGHVETDDVARVLVDLSRVDTNARSKIFADGLIDSLQDSVDVLRTKPHRSAGFKVLKAHDIPSVLLELGFMSNARDRQNMQNNMWREDAALAVVRAIEAWRYADQERAKLVLK